MNRLKNPASDPLVVLLHKQIKKVGKISQQDYSNLRACLKSGIWNEEALLQWARHFYEDPWREENKTYRTVAHFLRDPERWEEPKVRKESEEPWTLN